MIATKQKLQVSIRWMIRRDMPIVLDIEKQCFQFPWFEDDFIRCLRQSNNIAQVAEIDGVVVGFVIYELHKHKLHIVNFAVHEDCRYRGIGTALINKLKDKLHHDRRRRLVLEIRESNLDAQLFFKHMGFRAVSVMRGFYEGYTPEDAYVFQYRIGSKEAQ